MHVVTRSAARGPVPSFLSGTALAVALSLVATAPAVAASLAPGATAPVGGLVSAPAAPAATRVAGPVSSVSEIDFGRVHPGTAVVRHLVLTHPGPADAAPIVVSNAWLAEPDALVFATDFDAPVTLLPGQATRLAITFDSDAPVDAEAVLFVSHDGASGLELFTLSGRADARASASPGAAAGDAPPALARRAKPGSPGFGKSLLAGFPDDTPTSLQFGPDGRLYVAEMFGRIRVLTVERDGPNDYRTTAVETIDLVRDIPNHDDDGRPNPKVSNRLVTGLLVAGTAGKPVVYVASSDPRIGGGPSHVDTGLDTNSGVISRLDRVGGGWTRTDLVRGLSRSAENHTVNGLALDASGTRLYAAAGGNTNTGGPSNNFARLPEYALSAAILEIDLAAIGDSTYDLPTLDDETRPGKQDKYDPFGGNDGRNQAKLVPGGPVQVYAPGFRNPYDIVLTNDGRMYTVDNGGNAGWGGEPIGEGPWGACTNGLSEPGKSKGDGLHLITGRDYYGGHANPTRGNAANTFNASNPQSPVPASNPVECDARGLGADGSLTSFGFSTNGLVEYTASNFGGALTGDLLAAGWNNTIQRIELSDDGTKVVDTDTLFSQVGELPLDVTVADDANAFAGTIWVADFVGRDVVVYEPNDWSGKLPGDECAIDSAAIDADGDGYSNADEIANGTATCSGGDRPADADGDFVSDLLDGDDDGDGIDDADDPFALDATNGRALGVPFEHSWENGESAGGLFNMGFTGLMTNGAADWRELHDAANLTAGGAAGVFTIDAVGAGDPVGSWNSQREGFQLGLDVTPSTAPFTLHTRVLAPLSGASGDKYQSLGFYLGTGGQDDYVKLVVNGERDAGAVQLAAETGGAFDSLKTVAADVRGSDAVDLYLALEPATGRLVASYAVTRDGVTGPIATLPVDTTVPKAWLTGGTGLAVGIIATSFGAEPFTATWDFIAARDGFVDARTGGDGAGSAGGGQGGDQGGDQGGAGAGPAAGSVLYRVNVGGPAMTDASGRTWQADQGGAGQWMTTSSLSWNSGVRTKGGSAPRKILSTMRYSPDPKQGLGWAFPVAPGEHEVRLHFAETWSGAFANGARVFSIELEGEQVEGALDMHAEAGAAGGFARSWTVRSDGQLNVNLRHAVQNPALMGIEIVAMGDADGSGVSNDDPNGAGGSDAAGDDGGSGDAGNPGSDDANGTGGDDAADETDDASETTDTGDANGGAGGADSANDDQVDAQNGDQGGAGAGPAAGSVLYRVNVGGPAMTDASGRTWQADQGGAGQWMTTSSLSWNSGVRTKGGSAPRKILSTMRYSPDPKQGLGWAFPVAPGEHEVRLHFAETWSGAFANGARVFSIELEGEQVEGALDMHAEAGAAGGFARSWTVRSDGQLNVNLRHAVQNPALMGIEIVALGGAGSTGGSGDADGSTGAPAAPAETGDAGAADDTSDQAATDATDTVAGPTAGSVLYRVNVGGPAMTDASGRTWQADQGGAGQWMTTSSLSWNSGVRTKGGSAPRKILSTMRYSPDPKQGLGWAFPVAPGEHEVRLHFAETWSGAFANGARVFSIELEGEQVEGALDMHAEAGAAGGFARSWTVRSDGQLNVNLRHAVQNPALMGIEIVAMGEPG